jgi:hypothetical protein
MEPADHQTVPPRETKEIQRWRRAPGLLRGLRLFRPWHRSIKNKTRTRKRKLVRSSCGQVICCGNAELSLCPQADAWPYPLTWLSAASLWIRMSAEKSEGTIARSRIRSDHQPCSSTLKRDSRISLSLVRATCWRVIRKRGNRFGAPAAPGLPRWASCCKTPMLAIQLG